jgi:ABC-type bacteriocin/lantibiotic exporter with double-glycine peptidase domain
MNEQSGKLRVLASLLGYALRWRPSMLAVVALGLFSSALELAGMVSLVPLAKLATGQPLETGSIWLRLADALHVFPSITLFVSLFMGLMLFRALTAGATMILLAHAGKFLIAHLSSSVLHSFVRHLDFSRVQRESVGHFMTLAGDEANRASMIVTSTIRLVPMAALFLLYTGSLFVQYWQLGAGIAIFFAVTLLCLKGAFRKSHMLGSRQQQESRMLHTYFIEALNGLRTVRSFNAEDFVSSRYSSLYGEYARTGFHIDFINLSSRLVPAMVLMAALLAVTIFLADEAWLASQLPILLVGTMMVLRLMPVAGMALENGLRLSSDLRAANNIQEILHAVRDDEAAADLEHQTLTHKVSDIVFDHVSFRFAPDLPLILKDLNVRFETGKSYALVGPSGAGKSSLVDLLLKFFAPQGGAIRVNGTDISQLSTSALRSRILLVEQTTCIFYSSIRENIQLGSTADDQRIRHALRTAALDRHVDTLPEGMNTILAYQGSNFSGGQRQRIGLARGLAHEPDVLILDESTNALDSEVRENVVREILDTYRDRIVIFITHDPFVMERVDEVINLAPVNHAPISGTETTA